jgi:hypothetical protein
VKKRSKCGKCAHSHFYVKNKQDPQAVLPACTWKSDNEQRKICTRGPNHQQRSRVGRDKGPGLEPGRGPGRQVQCLNLFAVSPNTSTCTHTSTHTRAHAHTHEHTHTHTRAHAHTSTRKHASTRTHEHTHTHVYTHTRAHTRAHAHTRVYAHTRAHT